MYLFAIVDMIIKIIEMRRFVGMQFLMAGAQNASQFSVIYTNDVFETQVKELLEQKGNYLFGNVLLVALFCCFFCNVFVLRFSYTVLVFLALHEFSCIIGL